MAMRAPGLQFFILAACFMSLPEGQGQQIKSMRCDRKVKFTQNTPCTSCLIAERIQCPNGWQRAFQYKGKCRYTVKLDENLISLEGCNLECTKETEEKQCCPGFWGLGCYECPGGSQNVCSGHGVCLDGMARNGTCICERNYGGYTCQECRDENHFGPNCQSVCECQHGICNHGPSGDGSCTCLAGYTGPKCDQELPVCGAGKCEANSLCVVKDGQAWCECMPGYRKTGLHCQAQNPCSSSPCSSLALCKTLGPTKYECTCMDGYHGDGRVCQAINPCDIDNGGCPANSTTCRFESAGKAQCVCKPGMSRNRMGLERGMGCLSSGCQQHYCHRTSTCEIGPDGMPKCICQDGEIGDGTSCYGTILKQIIQLDTRSQFSGTLKSAKSMFGMKLLHANQHHWRQWKLKSLLLYSY